MRKVQRVRYINENLPSVVRFPRHLQRLQESNPSGAIDEKLSKCSGIGKGPLQRPRAMGRYPLRSPLILCRARALAYPMPKLDELRAIACPTMPVPRIPMFIAHSFR